MATITRDTTVNFRGQIIKLVEGQTVGHALGFYLARTKGPVELTDDETERLKAIDEAEEKRAQAAADVDESADEDDSESAETDPDDDSDADEDDSASAATAPAGNASREEWARHADTLGIEVDGLTRDEIKAAVAEQA